MPDRWVVHADIDAFFANAEVLRRPELRGRPVVVGGAGVPTPDDSLGSGRGVVSSATYEARAYGVRSAMPVAQARRLCPQAVFLRGDFAYYRQLSRQFRALLADLSPVVEIVSIDEAFLDATGATRAPGPPVDLGRTLQARLLAGTGLTVSVGLATNKTVAKIASDYRKPAGLTVVAQGEAAAFLAPLPVGRLPGVGPKAQARLAAAGIRTLGALAAAPPVVLRQVFGNGGLEIALRARGVDPRPLDPGGPAKSLGHETTFDEDVDDLIRLRRVIHELADRSAAELRRKELGGRVVTLKLRHADFQTLTRQRVLAAPTDQPQPLAEAADALLTEALAGTGWRRIRLIGVRVGGLAPLARQLDLFSPRPLKEAKLSRALNALEARFGEQVVRRGSVLATPDGLPDDLL